MSNLKNSGKWLKESEQARNARIKIIEIAKYVAGAHIGGSFSIIDFLIAYYNCAISHFHLPKDSYYRGLSPTGPRLIFSKGHCYLAQLIALDVVLGGKFYAENYLKKDSEYFGHPKLQIDNQHFQCSTGSLGQGVVFANGLSLGDKFNKNNTHTITILGDGEMNEGSCMEAMLFASQHQLNHHFIIDRNKQISLGKTDEIYNLGNLSKRFESINLMGSEIDGHDFGALSDNIVRIFNSKGPSYLILNTIKGKGVSFMEGVSKWHHRNFKGTEFEDSLSELNGSHKI